VTVDPQHHRQPVGDEGAVLVDAATRLINRPGSLDVARDQYPSCALGCSARTPSATTRPTSTPRPTTTAAPD
jgi:hypothetical protein